MINEFRLYKKKTHTHKQPYQQIRKSENTGKILQALETPAKKIQLVLLLFQLVNSAIDNEEGKHLTVVKNTDNFVALTTTQNIE